MAINNYTHISWVGAGGIKIISTDVKLLDDVIIEVKKFVPACDIYESSIDIHNDKSSLQISKLENKDSPIGVWLFRWLGQLGWEVFEVGDESLGLYSGNFYLRKHE
jgi:hypothetical protein